MTSTAELSLEAQLSQAGIPFERESPFHQGRRWRADFYFAADHRTFRQYLEEVLVEIDGGAFIGGRHSRGAGVEADRESDGHLRTWGRAECARSRSGHGEGMTKPSTYLKLILTSPALPGGHPLRARSTLSTPRRKWRADFRSRLSVLRQLRLSWITIPHRDRRRSLVPIGGRHSRGAGVEADCEKTSAAAILGYRVIRATPRQVEDGRCLEWIRQALGIAA